ncbi:MAG: glycosyltransferase [Chloroflexota bacterium]
MARRESPEWSSATSGPDVSVVVVSFNTLELLRRCLLSVQSSLALTPSLTHEIWVVDNASSDGSAAMVQRDFPGIKLIANEANRGFAAANNQALSQASGRFAMLLNPDTEVKGKAIATMVRFADEHRRVGIVGCRLVYPDGSFQHSCFRFPTLWMTLLDHFPVNHRLLDSRLNGRYPHWQYDRPFAIDHPLGAAMLVRREVFDQIGLFDEQFFIYCEEIDLCIRAKRAGWEVYCVPDAEIVHHAAQSTRQFRGPMLVELHRSRQALFQKHYSRGFQWLNRQLVKAGVSWEARQTRRQLKRGLITPTEAAERIEAYETIASSLGSGVREQGPEVGDQSPNPQSPIPGPWPQAPGPRVSAAVIAKNEERRIEDCLRSLQWADEIVVVDSFSTDRTLEICRRYTDRVYQRRFENFSKQRNHALDLVSCPWVLFVDADERVTPELAAEIRQALAGGPGTDPRHPGPVAYWVPRHNLIWGKWIRHAGWYPDYQLRLLRVDSARYDESREVHEVAEVKGETAHLHEPLIHHNYDTISQFCAKQDVYSTFEARLLFNRGIRPRWRNYIGAPVREFLYRYRELEGYRDGVHGLVLSALLAWYKFRTYVKLRALARELHVRFADR